VQVRFTTLCKQRTAQQTALPGVMFFAAYGCMAKAAAKVLLCGAVKQACRGRFTHFFSCS
jgi:hypothetical protein